MFIAVMGLTLAILACNMPMAQNSQVQDPTPADVQAAGEVDPTDTPPAATEPPASTGVPATEAPVATVCNYDTGYVADVTIPDDTAVLPNTPFIKTWRIQNTGSCDWEASTTLVYRFGDVMGGAASVEVAAVTVGASADISVSFTSPDSPGTYRSTYQMQHPNGAKFGQEYYVQIVVPEPTAAPPTETPKPTPTAKPVGNWPLVQQGAKGDLVYAIQYLLRAHGYSLSADGKFGPQTGSAVKAFQQAEGLQVDGIVGPNTWQALIQSNTVQKGDSGDGVRAAQYLLKHKHGHDIEVDGAFGGNTSKAVKSFQKVYGLKVDGIVGKNTWKALVAG
jgi:lysozyme family protein